jgi:hypothetical protein
VELPQRLSAEILERSSLSQLAFGLAESGEPFDFRGHISQTGIIEFMFIALFHFAPSMNDSQGRQS